jgi:hypothetical protein
MASTGLFTSLGYDSTDALTNALTLPPAAPATVPLPSPSPLPATSIVTGSIAFSTALTITSKTTADLNSAPLMVALFQTLRTNIASVAGLGSSAAASVTITRMTTGTKSIAFSSSDTVNQGSSRLLKQQQLQQHPRRLSDSTSFDYTVVTNSIAAATLQSAMSSPASAQNSLRALPGSNILQVFANTQAAQAAGTNIFLSSATLPSGNQALANLGFFATPVLTSTASTTGGGSSGGGGGGGGGTTGGYPVPPPSWPPGAPPPFTPGAPAPLAITLQLDNVPTTVVAFGALSSYGLSAITNAIATSVSAVCPACTTRVTLVRDASSGAVLFRALRRLQGMASSLLVDYTVTAPTGASASSTTSLACSASATAAISSALASNGIAGIKASQVSGCGTGSASGPLKDGEIAAIVICVLVAVVLAQWACAVFACRDRPCGERAGKAARRSGDVALPMSDNVSGIYEFDAEKGSTSSGLQLRGPKAALAQSPAAVGGSSRSHASRPTGTTTPAADTRAPPSASSASTDAANVMDSKAVLKNLSPSIFRMCV